MVAAITVTGIERATEPRRAARSRFLADVLQVMPVEPFELATAQAHDRLLAHVHPSGQRSRAHDLIIAATAVVIGRTVLTTDRNARFGIYPASTASS